MDPQIEITNQRVLAFFNFHGLGRVNMPFSLWVKCLYWKHFPPVHQVIQKDYKPSGPQ